jgi:hypothetical protein
MVGEQMGLWGETIRPSLTKGPDAIQGGGVQCTCDRIYGVRQQDQNERHRLSRPGIRLASEYTMHLGKWVGGHTLNVDHVL